MAFPAVPPSAIRNPNSEFPVSTHLNNPTVLVLNRFWQAIDVKTPADAVSMMVAGTATALNINEAGDMQPVRWVDWITLPVREGDTGIRTVKGAIRAPTVIVLARFARVPKRRPRFSSKTVWERDGGICQYTGRPLAPHEGNIDHVVPRSRGGATTWENCVLAHREINTRKGSHLPEEAGLRLIRRPSAPRELPTTQFIRNHCGVSDWKWFLGK